MLALTESATIRTNTHTNTVTSFSNVNDVNQATQFSSEWRECYISSNANIIEIAVMAPSLMTSNNYRRSLKIHCSKGEEEEDILSLCLRMNLFIADGAHVPLLTFFNIILFF